MALSRVRLRLAAGFALAFVVGLGALTAVVITYLWRQANHRLDTRLAAVAAGVSDALGRELRETPDSTFAYAAHEVVAEWPVNDESFAIVDAKGTIIAGADRAHAMESLAPALARGGGRFSFAHGDQDFHAIRRATTTLTLHARSWQFASVAYASTEGIESDTELLVGVLGLAAPLIVLLSLMGGYALSRRALRPVNDLRQAIATIAPDDLSHRLEIAAPADEIGALAAEFNALLGRLEDAQQRNRRFVREAAHQIRTPLTLVLGEAEHELAAGATPDARGRAALARIRIAAQHMQRRVDDLMLLAEAQTGEPVRLTDDVELDGLVLECTDLMRARASALGRTLAIGRADHVVVRGNAALLQEALLELIENGCRHGTPDVWIAVSTRTDGELATISVESAGEPFELPQRDPATAPEGLGLSIVEWIARMHGGELQLTREGERNPVSISLPRRAA